MFSSLFDTITGLPVHPLVVHFAVVLLPLAALMLIALVFVPRLRVRWALPTLVGLAAGTAASIVAKESGEALARRIGNPADHARWGDVLPIVAVALLLVSALWYVLQRREQRAVRAASTSSLTLVTGLLSAALALAATVITVIVGHTGAAAAWSGKMSDAAADTSAPVATSTASAASSAKATQAAGALTAAAVAQHATASDCWSIVNGNVYDLTSWVNVHPGGKNRIANMCGKDATSSFNAEHGGQASPEAKLATFKKGALAA